ncbi:MAG: hypothetical protein AB7F99_20670 [Vicinamibacterales bacterium]
MRSALDRLIAGVDEPFIGAVSSRCVQLCPQNFGVLDEAETESLRADYAGINLRLHANARVLSRHVLWDASTVTDATLPYFHALADRSRRLGADTISIHAGNTEHASLAQMFDNLRRLQDEVFRDVRVAVEGLYPHAKRPQLVVTWSEYEALLRSGLFFAVDLSHLHIVRAHEGAHDDLVRALLSSPQCLEVHTSGNDGRRDEHALLTEEPWWFPFLSSAGANSVVFTESNQARALRSRHLVHHT